MCAQGSSGLHLWSIDCTFTLRVHDFKRTDEGQFSELDDAETAETVHGFGPMQAH